MRMRKKKGCMLFFAAALLLGTLLMGDAPTSRAEETSALADNHGLKNPVVKAVAPPANTSHGLSNPRNDNEMVTWDCVYFGNYWQNDTNGDGVADKNDEKEPIKWRVLSVDGDDAFLLADTNLDVQRYNDTYEDVTWKTCTMRSWLNGTFLDNAFTESEQDAIKNTDVVNEDNPKDGTMGENDTQDKVYLLSLNEVMNPEYGFASTEGITATRDVVPTAYIEDWGATADEWWLRSPGDDSKQASCVGYDEVVNKFGGAEVNIKLGVRPVLHLNLSSDSQWELAGTVSLEGGEIIATWDCIWFGNYPQGDVAGETKEPIKWRVLSVDEDDVFLIADKNLDVQKYSQTDDVTWETCMMRAWLNDTFINKAFTESEQAAIKISDVINEDNPYYDTEGGKDTQDKIYLLSLSEVINPKYGFALTGISTDTREAVNTTYVAGGGAIKSEYMRSAGSADSWWLRSLGCYDGKFAAAVGADGDVYEGGSAVSHEKYAVRPVLHLNPSDVSVWSYAGTVSSAEKVEVTTPNPPVIPEPSVTSTPVGAESTPPASSTQSAKPQTTPPAVQYSVSAVVPSVASSQNVQTTLFSTVKIGQVTRLKLKAKKNAIKASWKKGFGAIGYEVQFSTSKKFTKKSTKTTKKMKFTIKKLNSNKKYFVRVRAYSVTNGKKTYGKWSKTMNVKTKK